MKIKSLSIEGFRGFNKLRTIDIHEKITLIHASNSYGKTSISEAFEWLIYGVTSKVDRAESKEEYKGSYRNRHFSGDTPSVKVTFEDEGDEIVFLGELIGDDNQKKITITNDITSEVEDWPLKGSVSGYMRPFILQHALKNLLLTKPDDRFQKFAELLGFEILDDIHKNIISLCTAPDRKVPQELKSNIAKVDVLLRRVESNNSLIKLKQAFKIKSANISEIYNALVNEAKAIIDLLQKSI
jgi:predicted ATP-dependent endonuclease of OLD family